MVGQLERYNPAMVALRPHVTRPLYFEIHRVSPFPNRSLDVDVVLDVMIHDLDAIQWLVGEDVKGFRDTGRRHSGHLGQGRCGERPDRV